jgi:acyl carrier protein
MREKLLDLIQDETGIASISEAMPLEDLGMDSLEFLDLLELIRKKIGRVDTGKATEANTVGELMAAVQM